VATNIEQVSQGARHTGEASNQVLASARSLASESDRLRSEVSNFLARVRAA
jgi:methyl-accepting chemotaxis protein